MAAGTYMEGYSVTAFYEHAQFRQALPELVNIGILFYGSLEVCSVCYTAS